MAKNITKPEDFFLGDLVEECIDLIEEQFTKALQTNGGLSYGDEITLTIDKTVRSDVAKKVGETYQAAGWDNVTWWYTDQRDLKQGTYFKFKAKLQK